MIGRSKSAFVVAGVAFLSGCGGSATSRPAEAGANGAAAQIVATGDDHSRCDFKGRADREVVESSGPGALMPNVRRVFGILGEGDDRRRVLFCREIDTNLDGAKDVVRMYNDKGESLDEQADSNYDGKVDTWIKFAGGRIAKVEVDTNNDGRPDETRYYVKGKISRAQRDTNNDGKPDVWEIYGDGQLERMGADLDFDGHVDRWDRDEVAHRVADEKEHEEEAKAEAARKAAEDAEKAANDKSTKPGVAKPGADATKPATGATKPTTDETKPSPDLTKPATDATKPATPAAKP